MQKNHITDNARRCFLHQATFAWLCLYLPTNITKMSDPKGVIIDVSHFSVDLTVQRLIELLKNKGAKIYTVIDQREELSHAGLQIPPMKFVLFGNPKTGGPVMMANPVAGLDLPLKVLVWADEKNVVRAAYHDPAYLKERYSLSPQLVGMLNLEPLLKAVLKA
ncbi:DUF302 domain-containing protein [Mucilaginibacter celer]|uniref:DUF302 domain-containing protein n=1 Tax=Mucilaginibacter celer TaxID=2305508 RepID=A0A494VVT4_9SPHI|nr:DUF302 domain-containing protein [Mucilaginibacter celer]AYL95375.1 DUF302 domain-containing protein [Mucilaginibacter celer]